MAKIESSFMRMRGRYGEHVFTHGTKQGSVLRKRPQINPEKLAEQFHLQSGRAAVLNQLASRINQVIGHFYRRIKPRDLYKRLLSHFRKEPSNNRFLLLHKLKKMEIHMRYRFDRLSRPTITTRTEENKLHIELKDLSHLADPKLFPEYCYEFLLLSWTNLDEMPWHDQQMTDWINARGPKQSFELSFEFPKGTEQWLLLLYHRGRKTEKEDDHFTGQGMKVLEAGSLLEADQKLMEERQISLAIVVQQGQKQEEQIKRVKGKAIVSTPKKQTV